MIRLLTLSLTALFLTGCFSNPMKDEPVDSSFYLIDLKRNTMCIGESNLCHDLSQLYVDPVRFNEVAAIYNETAAGNNDRTAILKTIIRPENGVYSGEKYSANGRYYKIPAQAETNQLFAILKDIAFKQDLIR